jgi:L-ascorbate metabolism protein UlaG (beta-lactamase superfamily)
MKLTFLGHSAIVLEHDGRSLLVDPFLTGNPKATAAADAIEADAIVVTHAHGDHVGDAVAIARRTGAVVVSNVEIANRLGREGVETIGANTGGRVRLPFAEVTFTAAWHSSSFDDGGYGGLAMGAVVAFGGRRVYHAGDTALFGDMALIGRGGLDVALLPIGDHFTMGPDDALEAVKLLRPRHVVPIHYGTFPPIEQDAGAFRDAVQAATDAVVHPLAAGEAFAF